MTNETFPEIQTATKAVEERIALTEAEVAEMKDAIAARRNLLRRWRKALAAFAPPRATTKKRSVGSRAARAGGALATEQ